MTRISRRNKLVMVQRPFNGPRDSIGRKERIWTDYGQAWVSLRQLSGGEQADGEQVRNFATYECRMLFVDAPILTTNWRLREGSSEPYTYYQIVSADQNEFDRKEWLLVVSRDERPLVDEELIEP